MNRFLGLLSALGLGIWAQRILTGPQPGIPRDALWLFIVAGVIFLLSAQSPAPLRTPTNRRVRAWPRRGWLLSLLGLGLGLVALALLWRNLQSTAGLLLWPVATGLFVAGTWLEQRPAAGSPPVGQSPVGELVEPLPAARRGNTTDASIAAGGPPVGELVEPLPAIRRGNTTDVHPSRSPLPVYTILLLLILLVAAAVRFYQLDVYPNGCQSDECNNGLDALKWLSGAPYTPYAETNEGQATLFTYLIALSFQLFGVGVTQMRLVSAMVGVLTVAGFYLLARELYSRPAALAATALLATARWHVTFSRIVYELIMQPLVMALLFWLLLGALRTGKRWQWALAGVLLAVGMNTYTAFRVVPFVVAGFLLFWLLRNGLLAARAHHRGASDALANWRQDVQGVLLLAGGAFTALLPLGVYTVQNWSIFTGRIRHISILPEVERLGSWQPVIDNFKKTLYMFNWHGDAAALNNLPGAPMLDTLVAVLFVLGLVYTLWYALRLRSLPVLYLLWFAGILSLGVLSVAHEAPTARRTIGLIPLIYLWVALVLDQWVLAWRAVWRGFGDRAGRLVLTALVGVVMASNARTYFAVQAPNPSVWSAYSPNESAVARYLAMLTADDVVLITPQFEHHSAVKLIGRDHSYRAFNPVEDVPYRAAADPVHALVYLLEPVDSPILSLLQQIYPNGQSEDHTDRYGQNLFLSFRVPAQDLATTQGLIGQYYAGYPPDAPPLAKQSVPTLAFDLAQAPLSAPYFAVWEGTLLVPAYGEYHFSLRAQAQAVSVQLGRENGFDLGADGVTNVDITLASGFHPLRIEVQSGAAPGDFSLTWRGPGLPEQIVGSDAVFAFRLGDQGLVGYYYPNGNWAGEPELVRNDLLVTPNNALREPFSILWRGKLATPVAGTYTIGTRSDDGSYVYIDGQLVVDNGGSHGAEDRSGQITLDTGFHSIEVRYNELSGSREMQLWWQPPGQGRAIIDSQYLFPLEGEEIPAGIALPPPPEIAEVFQRPLEEPAPLPPAGDAPVPAAQPSTDFALLPAAVAWRYGGVCGVEEGQLAGPRGVAVAQASGDVYIADTDNSRIVRLAADGSYLSAWGAAGEGPAQFQEVVDLAVEPDGTLVALDAVNQRLSRWRADGEFVGSFGDEYTFYRPRGLGSSPAGQLVIADTGGVRLVRLDATGALLGQAGGQASDLARQQPTDAALAATGDLYFVEAESGVVTRIMAPGNDVQRWIGPGAASTIAGPHLALLPDGRLLVTDPEGGRVLLFDAAGAPLGQFGLDAALVKPVGVAVADPAGSRILVADNAGCQVVAFDLAQ
ncbi:MAG: PA14 domain-containing protein [Anaerolineae bacterium]